MSNIYPILAVEQCLTRLSTRKDIRRRFSHTELDCTCRLLLSALTFTCSPAAKLPRSLIRLFVPKKGGHLGMQQGIPGIESVRIQQSESGYDQCCFICFSYLPNCLMFDQRHLLHRVLTESEAGAKCKSSLP